MAKPVVINWTTPDNAAVAQLQTTTGAGSLIINGNVVNSSSAGVAIFPNVYRTVTVTSTGDLSAVNFTITGIGEQSAVVSQTIAGPHNNTVSTTTLFNTVTSVTVNGAVGTNVSVGSGTTGILNWIKYNQHATVYGTTAAIVVVGTINYTLLATLDDVTTVASPTYFDINSEMVSLTTSFVGPFGIQNYSYTGTGAPTYLTPLFAPMPCNYYTVQINSSNSSGGLTATFIQQGIT